MGRNGELSKEKIGRVREEGRVKEMSKKRVERER